MFEKNLEFLTAEEAERIRGTRIAVIGLGALGQMAAHMLVRGGAERLTLCDGDRMSGSNLNRQLYADILTLGVLKSEVVGERLYDICPRLKLRQYDTFLDRENGKEILKDADLVLDCVDQIPVKLYLEELAEELGIPLIHGAVEGWFGQAGTIWPGDRILRVVYEKRREQRTSALMPAVSLTASVQTAEALKIAAGREADLRGQLLCADLLHMEIDLVPISRGGLGEYADAGSDERKEQH